MLVCLKVSPKENHCMVCFARRLSNLHVPKFFWLKPKCSTNCPGKGFVRKWSIPPELPISQENDDNPSESLELGLPFYPIYIYPHLNSMCFNHEIPYFSYSVHKSQYIPYIYEKSHMNPSISHISHIHDIPVYLWKSPYFPHFLQWNLHFNSSSVLPGQLRRRGAQKGWGTLGRGIAHLEKSGWFVPIICVYIYAYFILFSG